METLIVIAYHGDQYVQQCVDSIPHRTGQAVITVNTGEGGAVPGGHPTGAYRWAYDHFTSDRYLFIQDSMTAIDDDPVMWFADQWSGAGAVAWGKFGMSWDNQEQQQWVAEQYPGVDASHGIFGPVFYTDRASLDVLARRGFLPAVPRDRMQAQGTERAWAYAFAAAGLPLVGPDWNQSQMQVGFGPFKKVWAGRP